MSATVISNAITVNSRAPGGAATITSPRLRSPCAATASSRNNILVMAMLRLRSGSNCEGGGAHLRLPEIAEGEGARKTVLQRHHRRIGFDDERRYQFGERHIVRGGRRNEHSGLGLQRLAA